MIRRYQVDIHAPQYNGDWSTIRVGSFKSLAAATNRAHQVLRRHACGVTRYSRKPHMDCWAASVFDAKAGRELTIVDAEEHLVPSVGELGYW